MLGLKRVMFPSLGTTVKTHERIQEFLSGGGGGSGPGQSDKKSSDICFFFFFREVKWSI